MCGIAMLFARESVPSYKTLIHLMKGVEKRGQDGFGICLIERSDRENRTISYVKSVRSYSHLNEQEIERIKLLYKRMNVGDIIIMNSRAQPETEPAVEEGKEDKVIQPIINSKESIVLVHNGAIANRCVVRGNKYSLKRYSDIDSEAIIQFYLRHGKNMKKAMENITGGISAIMYDGMKDGFYMVQTHNPMAHAYIRGVGYFVASTNDVLQDCLEEIKIKYRQEAVNLWEDYYCHPLTTPYRIRYVDIDSGMQTTEIFEPNYLHPTWKKEETLENIGNPRKMTLVIASGGIDSFTTAKLLKLSGEDVMCVHFQYGHRGEKAEEWAITNLCERNDIPLKILKLSDVYGQIDNFSMLTNENVDITTGTDDLKTTNAWTCGRNMVMATLTAALAESLILQDKYDEIALAAGFCQLSESGCLLNVKNNKINMFDGKTKMPADIKVGDELLSFNFETNKLEKTTVVKRMTPIHKSYYKLHLAFNPGTKNSGSRTLMASGEHPFYVTGKGWTELKDLEVGNILNGIHEVHNGWVVQELEHIKEEVQTYNYHCEPNNNYFVDKILVHNSYPDNSENFASKLMGVFKYGTLVGNRIKFSSVCENIMKYEQWILAKELGYLEEFAYTISCDRPFWNEKEGRAYNCDMQCGSTNLSIWASQMAGCKDPRKFVKYEGLNYKAHKPKGLVVKKYQIEDIINRLLLPQKGKDKLLNIIKEK